MTFYSSMHQSRRFRSAVDSWCPFIRQVKNRWNSSARKKWLRTSDGRQELTGLESLLNCGKSGPFVMNGGQVDLNLLLATAQQNAEDLLRMASNKQDATTSLEDDSPAQNIQATVQPQLQAIETLRQQIQMLQQQQQLQQSGGAQDPIFEPLEGSSGATSKTEEGLDDFDNSVKDRSPAVKTEAVSLDGESASLLAKEKDARVSILPVHLRPPLINTQSSVPQSTFNSTLPIVASSVASSLASSSLVSSSSSMISTSSSTSHFPCSPSLNRSERSGSVPNSPPRNSARSLPPQSPASTAVARALSKLESMSRVRPDEKVPLSMMPHFRYLSKASQRSIMQQLIERFQKGEPTSGGTTPGDLVGLGLGSELGDATELAAPLDLATAATDQSCMEDPGLVENGQMMRMFDDTGAIGSGMTPRGHTDVGTESNTPRSKNAAAVASAVAAIAAASMNSARETPNGGVSHTGNLDESGDDDTAFLMSLDDGELNLLR